MEFRLIYLSVLMITIGRLQFRRGSSNRYPGLSSQFCGQLTLSRTRHGGGVTFSCEG